LASPWLGLRRTSSRVTQTLSHSLSPLEQARRLRRGVLSGSMHQFSELDQAILKHVLSNKFECVYDALFVQPAAHRKIFDDVPPISWPDTSWYHPFMENLSDVRVNAKSVGAVLLTAAEERALFLQFNYCRYQVTEMKARIGTGGIRVNPAKKLLHWYHKAEAYRHQIAQTNLALVLAMAKRTRMSEVDFSDLVSEGNMALLRAVDKFDVSRGFKFSTYACRAILKSFSRSGVKLSKYRQLFPTDFDQKLEKSDFMEKKRAIHELDCVDEIRQIIQTNRAELTDIEQEVLEHRFALGHRRQVDPDCSPLTLEQVGKIIGVTKERVRQIQNKALVKIRQSLDGGFLS